MVKLQAKSHVNTSTDVQYLNVNTGIDSLECAFNFSIDFSHKKQSLYPVTFDGAIFGDAAKVKWNFGDGGQDSTTISPVHDYTATGLYTVTMKVEDPHIGESHTFSAVVDIPTAVSVPEYNSLTYDLNLYPNPVSDMVTITYSLQENTQVEIAIYDILGKKISELYKGQRNSGITSFRCDMSQLSNGAYYILMKTRDGTVVKELLLNK
jgi:hypothetical protein